MSADRAVNVVPFRRSVPGGVQSRDQRADQRRDQRRLMDAIYSAASLPVAAGDRETKLMASRLQVFGFIVIDEITANGDLRRLRPSESMRASAARPWRVSKPSFERPFAVPIPETDAFLFEAPRPIA